MKSLFRGSEVQERIKESLKGQLLQSIKEVQLEHSQLTEKHIPLKSGEATSALCTALEATFIHGLKEKLVDKMSSVFGDPDQRPDPDFWAPLMIISHRDVMRQIGRMSQITTDIGRCRAWIRLALNDSILLSYLEMIVSQNRVLSPYYKKTAFLRDADLMSLTLSFLGGLSTIPLELPTNSSLLNVWTSAPLLMAGVWTGSMKSCPVQMATDVAKTIPTDVVVADDTSSLISFASYQSTTSSYRNLLDEEEALKIILGTPIEDSPIVQELNLQAPALGSSPGQEIVHAISTLIQASLSEIHPSEPSQREVEQAPEHDEGIPESLETQEEEALSYDSLLENYNLSSRLEGFSEANNLEDFIKKIEAPSESAGADDSDENESDSQGFEVISDSVTYSIKAPEFKSMIEKLSKLAHEPGLDSQNYSCCECKQPVGVVFCKPRLCSMTGVYYCSDCFMGTEWIIPARILLNWDFRKYPVSGKVSSWLIEIQDHPLLDIRRINPRLYLAVKDMEAIQKRRMQLNLLRGYLLTCRPSTKRALQKHVWPREYLYEHVHLYSIADLIEIKKGAFGAFLDKVIKSCEDHVLGCVLCSQKGFICEICHDPKVIYPFHLETSFRCSSCKTVFHSACWESKGECRKCERLKQRSQVTLSEDVS